MTPGARFRRLATVGLACAFVVQNGFYFLERPIWMMSPQEWCAAPDFVQARFTGFKALDMVPVEGSEAGAARLPGGVEDVPFAFINDPSPGSAKALGFRDFGVWRWYGAGIGAVHLTIRHEWPDAPDGPTVLSGFGWYEVPADISSCPF